MLAYLLATWLNKVIVEEFEFEITPGERLPAETRMPLPEMSYAQELLNTPIPFQNRVSFLSDYVKPESNVHTAKEIAKILNISIRDTINLISEVDAKGISETVEGEMIYELFTLEVIQEEVEWEKSFSQLDDYISVGAISYYISKHRNWVIEQANELGVCTSMKINRQGKELPLYPRELAWMLRTILLHFPLANDWYSTDELVELLGRGHEWVRSTAEKLGIDTGQRVSALSNIIIPHYPPQTFGALKEYNDNLKPAGSWRTAGGMADVLGKHMDWIRPRIKPFRNQTEKRLDNVLKEEVHYPPEVLEYLRNLLEA